MTVYPLSALVIAAVGTVGLVIHSTLPRTGKIRPGMFCFYTNQSNLLVVLYELALFTAWLLRAGAVYQLLVSPNVAMAVAACIWITHLIYHFVLVPWIRRTGGTFADSAEERTGNVLVHYITPLMTLLQWLLWADKSLNVWSAVWWLLLPLGYFAYAMLRARSGKPIGRTDLLYPYPFLDYPTLGPKKFWLGIGQLLVFYFALGLVLVGAGRLILLLG